ncbi:hypothetical protein QV65_04690 [Rhodococcus erythropolis]|nr:hypothetical protein QV65_04690 [Rhodococcus erythropolis]
MLLEQTIFHSYEIDGNPWSWLAVTTESAPYHDHVLFDHGVIHLVGQFVGEGLDQIEETVTTWSNVCTVLNVARRPEM